MLALLVTAGHGCDEATEIKPSAAEPGKGRHHMLIEKTKL